MVHRRMSTHGGVPGLGGSRKVRPPGAGHGCGAHETPPAPGWQILPPSPVPIGRVSGASWTKSPNCTQIESAHCGVEISPYHLPGIILDGRTRADIICVQIWLLIHIGPPRRSATSNGAALAVVPAGQKMRAAGVAMSPTPTAAEAKKKADRRARNFHPEAEGERLPPRLVRPEHTGLSARCVGSAPSLIRTFAAPPRVS